MSFTVLGHRDSGEREPQKDPQFQLPISGRPDRLQGCLEVFGGFGILVLCPKRSTDVVVGPRLFSEITRLPGPVDPGPARLLCFGVASQPVQKLLAPGQKAHPVVSGETGFRPGFEKSERLFQLPVVAKSLQRLPVGRHLGRSRHETEEEHGG